MTGFDYDVLIIGSGFGGSVAALRAAEKGYRVGVMESGRRWRDEDIPKTQWDLPGFLWFPAAELYGIQRIEYLDDVLVLCGAGVGGGSHVYANTLYVPPRKFFDAPEWAGITDWAGELAPYLDQASRMLGVVRYPYMPTDVDRSMKDVATEMGRGETFNKAPVGVYFGRPGIEAEDPYFGGAGPRRTGCISCGNCNNGCGHNAKNKVTTNYLYLAERLGVEVRELHEVYDLAPLDGGGFEVHARHPGWTQRAAHLHHHSCTAEQVIVAAHAYGSAKLLHHMQHAGRLTALSGQLGQRARTNSEQLLAVTRSHEEWERDRDRIRLTPGSVSITSGVWPDPVTSIEPVYWGVGSDLFAYLVNEHRDGAQKHPTTSFIKDLAEHPGRVLAFDDARHWSERTVIMLCSQTTDTSIELYWDEDRLRSRHGAGAAPAVHIPVVEKFVGRLAEKMRSREGALLFEIINRGASAHFVGGIPIGDSRDSGAVDPYLRVFGQPGLHVMDGSVMPANPGVNPSLTITALVERAMSLWPNKTEPDTRPPLGSGYERVNPIMPHRPAVPAGAPGELRLDAKQSEQALQSLSRTYTIRGTTARAYNFLYGNEKPDAQRARGRERLHSLLRRNPSEIHASLAAEKLDERDDDLPGHDLTIVSLDNPRQWSMSWTTHPDVYSARLPQLDEWAATVDVAEPDQATEAFFPSIARHGRSYNLILPRKVQGAGVEPWQNLFGAGWTPVLDETAQAGLLYVIDLRVYETLQAQQVAGAPRFTPSTVTVLVQDPATKALTPELIRVAGGGSQQKIFSRRGSTTSAAWLYALQTAKVSVTVYGIWLGHVYQWHIVTAAMLMTMFQTLPADNPARRLLEPQSNFLIPFDEVLLLQWSAAAPPTSVATGRQFLELIDRFAAERRFFDDDPVTQLEHLGLTESDFTVSEPWDQFRIVGDLLAIWDATGRYVNIYVDNSYPADRDVQHDRQLGRWIAESGDADGGNVRGLPAMDSKDALKRVLHSLIYRITAHGTSRLYRSANPVLTFVANFPPCLQDATIPDPTDSFDTQAPHRFLPNTGTIGSMLHFYFIFWATPPYVPFVPLEGTEAGLFFDDEKSNEALIELPLRHRLRRGARAGYAPDLAMGAEHRALSVHAAGHLVTASNARDRNMPKGPAPEQGAIR